MAVHAKDSLRGSSIAKVFDLSLTIATLEAVGAESLISGQDSEIFNFVEAAATAVCTIVAYQGAVAKKEEVGIGIEKCIAGVASEAVDMPSVAGCTHVSRSRITIQT